MGFSRSYIYLRVVSAICLTALLSVTVAAQTPAAKSASDAAYYDSIISKMVAAGNEENKRSQVAKDELAALGVSASQEEFVQKTRRGTEVKGLNVIGKIESKKATRTIMIGAHLDKVEVGKGALDNASGVATVLLLVKRFQKKSLKNINLVIGFWDKEEMGLMGSRAYVEKHKEGGLPEAYINFDIYGYGDTLWLWTKDKEADFIKSAEKISKKTNFSLAVTTQYPGSDHMSFSNGGVKAYSFSLLTKTEVEAFGKMFSGTALEPDQRPLVMRTIHTDKDVIGVIDSGSVVRSLPTLEGMIRDFSKK